MVLKTMLEVPTKLTKLVKTKDCPRELTNTRQLDNTDVAHLISQACLTFTQEKKKL